MSTRYDQVIAPAVVILLMGITGIILVVVPIEDTRETHGNNVLYIFSDLLGENESALIKFAHICR